ncbi:MAG: hypothetical protein VX278_09470 [Myxococcota bacterium]|nr:hypothetical protein [Myxococcota bacterium]
MKPKWVIFGAYLCVATVFFGSVFWGEQILGGAQSDIWNSLWSAHFFGTRLSEGIWSLRTDVLNYPSGGTLWISDPLGAITMGPLMTLLGITAGYHVWVILCMTALGYCAHGFALDLGAKEGAWIAGFGVFFSGVVQSSIQNGASEAIHVAWVLFAVWKLWVYFFKEGDVRWAFFASFMGGISSWYGAVIVGVFFIAFVLSSARSSFVWRSSFLLGWCVCLLPWIWLSHLGSQGEDNLISIKGEPLLRQVRRTIGPADPLSYIMPLDFRSPDFSVMSTYGEDYIHCCYVGWCLLVLCAYTMRKRKERPLFWSGLTCFVLSLGPVLLHKGSAWIFADDRAIPLPYFLLEFLWGFDSLSLLYRLSFGVVIVCALYASLAFQGRKSYLVIGLIFLEWFFVSPVRDLPQYTALPDTKGLTELRKEPKGAVLHHPIAGGNFYLFEQIFHGHALIGSFNFPNNRIGKKIWRELLQMEKTKTCVVSSVKEPVYLLIHPLVKHRPMPEDRAIESVINYCRVIYSAEALVVVEIK